MVWRAVPGGEKSDFFLSADECEKNVGNGKYSGVEAGIGIGGVEMWKGLER